MVFENLKSCEQITDVAPIQNRPHITFLLAPQYYIEYRHIWSR